MSARLPPLVQGVDQLRQGLVTLPADHIIGVLQPFQGQKTGVGAAQDHRQALLAVEVRQLVSPGGGGGDAGDTHQVGLEVQLAVIGGGHLLDDHFDLHPLLLQDGPQQQRPQPGNGHPAKNMLPGRPGFDEQYLLNGPGHVILLLELHS